MKIKIGYCVLNFRDEIIYGVIICDNTNIKSACRDAFLLVMAALQKNKKGEFPYTDNIQKVEILSVDEIK